MSSIIKLIGDQAFMQVLRSLLLNEQGIHLRQLAFQLRLSPAGVSDIIRRIKKIGVLKETKLKNKKCYSLNLQSSDALVLNKLFAEYENIIVQERTVEYSNRASEKIAWLDEAYIFYKKIKSKKKK